MKLEFVYDKGYMHQECLSQYVGSNEAVDTRGNKYEYDHTLNRWEKKENQDRR
jgi:hypothetical protein